MLVVSDFAAGILQGESRLIDWKSSSAVWRTTDGLPVHSQSWTSMPTSSDFLISHPQGSKEGDELPENAAVWKQSSRKQLVLVHLLVPG
ncbi:uncharacterized protein LOC144008076 isoform X3 [Festucalex cinctus]